MNTPDIVHGLKPVVFGKILKLEEVENILGKDHVISLDESINAWARVTNLSTIDGPPIVRYFKGVVKGCARENNRKRNPANWHLIYLPGISLVEMMKVFRTGPAVSIPSFTGPSTWISKKSEAYWANQKIAAGYYLINLMPCYPGATPEERNVLFGDQASTKLAPATAAQFVCAIFTRILVSPEKARQHRPDYYHISTEVAAKGRYVAAGNYRTNNGLDINGVLNIDPTADQNVIHGTATVRIFNL